MFFVLGQVLRWGTIPAIWALIALLPAPIREDGSLCYELMLPASICGGLLIYSSTALLTYVYRHLLSPNQRSFEDWFGNILYWAVTAYLLGATWLPSGYLFPLSLDIFALMLGYLFFTWIYSGIWFFAATEEEFLISAQIS